MTAVADVRTWCCSRRRCGAWDTNVVEGLSCAKEECEYGSDDDGYFEGFICLV